MTTPRHGYRPWTQTSQVNERRIVASDRTPTYAVQGEDRRGIENTAKLHRHLCTVLGSKGNWQQQSERRYAKERATYATNR